MGLLQDKLNQSGGQKQQPSPENTGFMHRLALSFGGKAADEERARIEQQTGTAGKFDVGDIADVAGHAIPLAASIAGGIFGNVGGAALGAAGGEAARRGIGKLIGTNEDTFGENAADVLKEGAYTYAGGKVLSGAGKLIAKSGITKALPERLYSTFFKTTSDDLTKLAKTSAISDLQTQNPEMFENLVKEGLVRVGKSGTVELNPTLAQEALERGLGRSTQIVGGKVIKTGGSLEKMADYTLKKQLELELAARTTARTAKDLVPISNTKGYIGMLKDLSSTYKTEGYGFLKEASKEANDFVKILTKSKGKLKAETALDLRRLLDGFRNSSSFRMSPTLGTKQAVFKEGANSLRRKIAEVPGMRDIMNEYRFNIEAAENLLTEAARRGNTKIFGLFDAFVGGSSIGAMGPAGLSVWAGLRTIQTPAVLTAIARSLYKLPELGAKALPYIAKPAGDVIKNITE